MRWLVLALLVVSCTAPPPPSPDPTAPAATPTPRPATPDEIARAYFDHWQAGQWARMYELLTTTAQAQTPQDLFVRRHSNIRTGIGETRITLEQTDAGTTSGEGDSTVVELPFEASRDLPIFGAITESNTLRLVEEGGVWRVEWHPGVIFSGLTASTSVRFASEIPPRGRIVDRSGAPLADNGSILAIGVVPGDVADEPALLAALSKALAMPENTVKQRYQGGEPTWFMPVATRPATDRAELEAAVGSIAGVALQDRPARVYSLGAAAAHVVGYVTRPTGEDLQQRASEGLDEADWIGRAGLEASFEQTLAGRKGGAIQIVDATNRVLRTIAQRRAERGHDVVLELNAAVQAKAFEALGERMGSVVVLDPRDNAVLALVSAPSFDPNRFIIGLSDADWQEMNGASRPLVLRATESAYPTGSVFKVITMAAGLERGGFRATQTFDCGPEWHGLPGQTLRNWEPQGTLSLTQALTQSCNPAFYEIGLALDRLDPTILPSFAAAFGLGRPTQLQGVAESSGTVPGPEWKQQQLRQPWTSGDTVNLAIGQGYLLATPLQVANAYAALARGDGVRPPRVVVNAPEGELQSLGISSSTRSAILEGMQRVTSTPRGTAAYAFQGSRLQIAAKTGSAENENPDAHAWFVGFTPPEGAKLLVLAMVEGGQQGSTVAAPIGRQVLEFANTLVR